MQTCPKVFMQNLHLEISLGLKKTVCFARDLFFWYFLSPELTGNNVMFPVWSPNSKCH